MRGYVYLITARTINDYVNGCLQHFLKNNFKIILLFTIFNYICGCDNNPSINYNNDYVEMAIDNRIKNRRPKPLVGNSGYTGKVRKYKLGGEHDRVVDGVHYRDRVKSGVR